MMRRLIATALAVVAAAATVLAVSMTVVQEASPPATRDVTVLPPDYPSACPGALEVPVGDIDAGDDELAAGSDDRERDVWTDAEVTEVDDGDASIVRARVASAVERVGTGDIAGLAGFTCLPPQPEQWLVGGSTALGSSARLVVVNPSGATVEVEVSMFGPSGPLDEQRTFAVGPGAERELLLEGLVADVPSLVVRVQASGAGVVAALQDSRLDGFQPAGTDWVDSLAAATDEAAVVGLGDPQVPADQQSSLVRLMSPEGATVSLTMVTPTGIVAWGGTANLELEPGVVVDVPAPDGAFGTAEVEASEGTVLAGGMTTVSRPADEGLEGSLASDLAWAPGQDHRDAAARSVIVPSGQVEVMAYSPSGDGIVLRDGTGAEVAREPMQARSMAVIPLDVAPETEVIAEGDVAWLLRVSDEPGFLTTLAPVVTGLSTVEWSVRQGPYVPAP